MVTRTLWCETRLRVVCGALFALTLGAASACSKPAENAPPASTALAAAASAVPVAPSSPPVAPSSPPVAPTPPAAPALEGWPADLPVLPGGQPYPMNQTMAKYIYPAPPEVIEPAFRAALRAAGWGAVGAERYDARSRERNFAVCHGATVVNIKFTPRFSATGASEGESIMASTHYTPPLPAGGCPPPA